MHVSPAAAAAMTRIAERARDVERAFGPGARPEFDDAARAETSYPTLDALSAVAPEGAYFAVREPSGRVAYTRDGSFTLRDGVLSTRDGSTVLGVSRGRQLTDVAVDPVDFALGNARDARLDRSGALVFNRRVVDPRTGAGESVRVVAGRVALARFPAGTRLSSDGEAPAGVTPSYGLPGDGVFSALVTMRREGSGIDIDRGLDRLRTAYRQLDAVQGALAAQYRFDKTAMDVVK